MKLCSQPTLDAFDAILTSGLQSGVLRAATLKTAFRLLLPHEKLYAYSGRRYIEAFGKENHHFDEPKFMDVYKIINEEVLNAFETQSVLYSVCKKYPERCKMGFIDRCNEVSAIPGKPTADVMIPLVKEYMTFGRHSFHILLDDLNVEDSHVVSCMKFADESNDKEGIALGKIFLKMSKTQRLKIARKTEL
jgi:hypothetical protein